MKSPDDEELPFVARWNLLVSALIVDPSVKLVARTAVDYGVHDGENIYPGNERLARETGLNSETVRKAWKLLRALGMAQRDVHSFWDGRKRHADLYALEIPTHRWRHFAIYGPHFQRFACQHCGKAYNPQGGTSVWRDGSVGWGLRKMLFCPAPGTPHMRPNGERPPTPPSCLEQWEENRKHYGLGGWRTLSNDDAWEMFRKARDDEWP